MKRLLVCMALIAAFTLGACSGAEVQMNDEEETVEAFSSTRASNDGFFLKGICIVVDSKTGVNYIAVERNYSVSITPRYNADGSLYVSEEGE